MKKLNKLLSIMLAMVLVISTMAVTVKADNTAATEKVWAWTDFSVSEEDVLGGSGVQGIVNTTTDGPSSGALSDGAFVYTQNPGARNHWANPSYIRLNEVITREKLLEAGYDKMAIEFDFTVNDSTGGAANAIIASFNVLNGVLNSHHQIDIRYNNNKINACNHGNGVEAQSLATFENGVPKKIKLVTSLADKGGYFEYDVYVDGEYVKTTSTRIKGGGAGIQSFVFADMQCTIPEEQSNTFTLDNLKIYSDDSMEIPDEIVWAGTNFDNLGNGDISYLNMTADTGIQMLSSTPTATSSAEVKDGAIVYTQSAGTKAHWSNPLYIVLNNYITKASINEKGFKKVAVEFDLTCESTTDNADAIFSIMNTDGGVNSDSTYFDIRYSGDTGEMKTCYKSKITSTGFANIKNNGTKKIKIVTDLNAIVEGSNKYCAYDIYVDGFKATSSFTKYHADDPSIKRLIIADMALSSSVIAEGTSRSFTVDNLKVYSSKELDNPTEVIYVDAGFDIGDKTLTGNVDCSSIDALGMSTITIPTNENTSTKIENGKLVYSLGGSLTNANADAQLVLPFSTIYASNDYDKVVVEADITATEVKPAVTDETTGEEEEEIILPYSWMFTVRSLGASNYFADVRWDGRQIRTYGKNSAYVYEFDFENGVEKKLRYVIDLKQEFKLFNANNIGYGYFDLYYGDELIGSYLYPRDTAAQKQAISDIFFGPWQQFDGTRTFTIDNLKVYSSKAADEKYTKANDTVKRYILWTQEDGSIPAPTLQSYTEKVKLRVDMISNYDANKNFTFITAFKQGGKIVDVEITPNNVLNSNTETIFELNVPDDLPDGEYDVEVYIWDDVENMSPLCNMDKYVTSFNLVKTQPDASGEDIPVEE